MTEAMMDDTDAGNDDKFFEEHTRKIDVDKPFIMKQVVFTVLKRTAMVLFGYLICYFNCGLTLPILTVSTLVWLEMMKLNKSNKISIKAKAASMNKKDILRRVEELPSWVVFPDRERAEWLNEIIIQLWPSINSYITKRFRGSLQTHIRKKFDSFRFEDIDFGMSPPKIDGVKVYRRSMTKDSVIIDFDIYYDGDCDIKFSMSGAQIGCIKDFQFGAELRLVLKPLMIKMPIVGGIQLFFLNTPDINFELEGISGIPGFSYFIRQKIEERITKKFVFPNKVTKRFTKSVEAAELKSLEPSGMLRVHVFEAKDLERKDITGKSDPYVVLNVGAQERKTHVVKRDLNPQWDYWCEFTILDPMEQFLQLKVFDQDLNGDDFLGSGLVEIHSVLKEGQNDKWFLLDECKHGVIHLRFTWLGFSSCLKDLEVASQEAKLLKVDGISTALLIVYLDTAEDLQKVKAKKPDPYAILTVGREQQKSKTKKHTCDPVWEQGFLLPVQHPESDTLNLSIIDKGSDAILGHMMYNLRTLLDMPELHVSRTVFFLSDHGKIILSLQLKILKNMAYASDETDSDSDDDHEEKSTHDLERKDSEKSTSRLHRSTSACSNYSYSSSPAKADVRNEEVEEPVTRQSATSFESPVIRPFSRVKPDLGQIELSLYYNSARQKLIVAVHKITNLPLKDPSDIPDPYVKLKLLSPDNHKIKNKTKVVTDNCDPVFEETFEYLLSKSELSHSKLIITIKTKKLFFNSNVIGQVTLNFDKYHELSQEPLREWFDLSQAEDSD